MQITLLQAILVGMVYFAANTSFLAGLGYFSVWRPLVNGLLIGLILGNPVRGTTIGALINVLYLGYISVGGTLGIGDAALAGILGAVVGVSVPMTEPAQAIGLGVIAGVLIGNIGFPLLTLRMTLDNRIVMRMEQAADKGDTRSLVLWNILGGQGLLLALTLPFAAILALLAPSVLTFLTASSPTWVLRGIGVAGTGVASALGIALAMKFTFKGWGILLFFVGLATVVALHINIGLVLIPILICITIYTLVTHLVSFKHIGSHAASRAFWLWQFFSHSSYSFERLQGSGFACAMTPIMKQTYPRKADLINGLKRQLNFFNVEPNWGSIVLGIAARLETQYASGIIGLDEIMTTRQSLMGTVSGFGDTASQGAILPFLLSLGLAVSLDPTSTVLPMAGVCAYLLLICPLMLAISYTSFQVGFEHGRDAVVSMLGDARLKRWIVIAELLGALMLGVLAAMPAVTGLRLNYSDDLLGRLFALALPLVLVLAFFLALQKFLITPVLLLVACISICMLLALVGVI
jgi:mannose/fructose/N-acetylgalactosamine-specific phosphotransferase system component IID/mannose/fructose/N-acetylgalactosamine-specific phosphotransferase system component IIC